MPTALRNDLLALGSFLVTKAAGRATIVSLRPGEIQGVRHDLDKTAREGTRSIARSGSHRAGFRRGSSPRRHGERRRLARCRRCRRSCGRCRKPASPCPPSATRLGNWCRRGGPVIRADAGQLPHYPGRHPQRWRRVGRPRSGRGRQLGDESAAERPAGLQPPMLDLFAHSRVRGPQVTASTLPHAPAHYRGGNVKGEREVNMKRREFLTVMAATAAVPLAAGAEPGDPAKLERPKETKRGDMLYRQLGRTGEEVSVIGLGGHHIGRQKEEKESIEIIRAAIDAGITFMDNCWDYHDGGSEIRMGKALQDGYRKKVFLMTKIDGRTKKAAAEQIDESPAAAADRRDRPAAVPRDHPPGRPRPHLRRGRGHGGGAGGQEGGQGPLHRLHRPQGPAGPPADAGGGGEARLPLRHGADAAQRHGRPLPQLRPARSCRCWSRRASACWA